MADELVRVRLETGGRVIEKNMGRALAEMAGVTILDEPVRNDDGSYRDETAKDGRPVKDRTSVDAEAQKKATSRSASTSEKE